MFAKNLKTVRKTKGLTQEELSIRLNVVRQTVSKWEKGLSVPDAEMLIKIAEIFEVSVSELLGSPLENETSPNEIADQLARINEQLAIKNRRGKSILKVVLGVVIGIIVVNIILVIVGAATFYTVTDTDNATITEQKDNMDAEK